MAISELYKLTEIELTYKSNRSYNERHKVTSAKVAFDLLLNNWNENKIELLEPVSYTHLTLPTKA